MSILYAGVDTLYLRLGIHGECLATKYAIDRLREWDELKGKLPAGEPNPIVQLGKVTLHPFELHRGGTSIYRYKLTNPQFGAIKIWNRDINLKHKDNWNNPSAKETGQILIEFNSYYLMTYGVAHALQTAENLAAAFFQGGRSHYWLKITRLDICADIERAAPLLIDEFKKFRTRAKYKDRHLSKGDDVASMEEGEAAPQSDNKGGAKVHDGLAVVPSKMVERTFDQPETVGFGSLKSPIYCRIYNKRLEARRNPDKDWEGVWRAKGAAPDSCIYRVEYQLRGEFLKELVIDGEQDYLDPHKALAALDSIWAYLTRRWLVQVERRARGEGREAVLTELWETVASAQPAAEPATRYRPYRPIVEQLRAQLRGVFTTIAAKLGKQHDCSAAVDEWDRLGEWMFSNEFLEKYQERRDRLGAINTNLKSNYARLMRITNQSTPRDFAAMVRGSSLAFT